MKTNWLVAAVALGTIAGATPTLAASTPTVAGSNVQTVFTKGLKPLSADVLRPYTNCTAGGAAKNPNLTIAFAMNSIDSPWSVAQINDFKLWVKKLCVPHFIWNQANENVAKQLSNTADLLAEKPNVLVIDPEASQPLVPAIGMAKKAGIPMIVIDRKLPVLPGPTTYPAVISANNFAVGFASAEAWIAKLKKVQKTDDPKGNLAIISGGVGQEPTIERDAGVEAAIKPYPGIKIVANQSGDWSRAGGRRVMEAFLQRFRPGQLQGVFAASDETMVGARQALEVAHRTDLNGWFFTGDGQREGIQAVVDGFDVATTQFPPLYGAASLQAAIAISEGLKLPSRYFTLDQRSFTCLTTKACDQAKAYLAQLKANDLQF